MANLHIEIATQTRMAAEYRAAIRSLQECVEDILRLRNISVQLTSGGDYTAMGSALGITSADAETVYGLLAGANSVLQGADVSTFLSRLG